MRIYNQIIEETQSIRGKKSWDLHTTATAYESLMSLA